jgi:hypothetical protein
LHRGCNALLLSRASFQILRGDPDFSRIHRIAVGGPARQTRLRIWVFDTSGKTWLA